MSPDPLGALAGLVSSADGAPILIPVLLYDGPLGAGAKVVEPLRTIGTPLADSLGPMPSRQVPTLFDAGASPAARSPILALGWRAQMASTARCSVSRSFSVSSLSNCVRAASQPRAR